MDKYSDDIKKNKYSEQALETNWAEFEKVARSRRSCRVFKIGEKIPQEIMQSSLEMATLAPNSSNLQPWEFYWVRSKEKKAELVKACLSQPAAATASEIIVAIARTDTWKKNCKQMLSKLKEMEVSHTVPKNAWFYYKKIVPFAYNQGPLGLFGLLKKVFITLMAIKKATPREPTSRAQMINWATKTTALGCENFMLAMRAHGFDTCPMEGLDSKRVKNILGLGRGAHVVMAISCGRRPNVGIFGPQVRFDKEQFIKEV